MTPYGEKWNEKKEKLNIYLQFNLTYDAVFFSLFLLLSRSHNAEEWLVRRIIAFLCVCFLIYSFVW
jgi:hypothetical protein